MQQEGIMLMNLECLTSDVVDYRPSITIKSRKFGFGIVGTHVDSDSECDDSDSEIDDKKSVPRIGEVSCGNLEVMHDLTWKHPTCVQGLPVSKVKINHDGIIIYASMDIAQRRRDSFIFQLCSYKVEPFEPSSPRPLPIDISAPCLGLGLADNVDDVPHMEGANICWNPRHDCSQLRLSVDLRCVHPDLKVGFEFDSILVQNMEYIMLIKKNSTKCRDGSLLDKHYLLGLNAYTLC